MIEAKKIIIFGAGKIGRSFIGQLFSRSGYKVVFIDVSEIIINELNRRNRYEVVIRTERDKIIEISNVSGINAFDTEAVVNEIASCSLMATCVGKNTLPRIFPVLAKGIEKRFTLQPGFPLDIILAENIRDAGAQIRSELTALLGSEFQVSFYGSAGNDEIARKIFKMVKKTPLNISNYKKVGDKPTSFTDVFSDSTFNDGQGERTFVNNIGAAWDYTPEMLSSDFFDARIICFGGTALLPQIHDNLTQLLKTAKENNCITVVNTVFDFHNEKNAPGDPWPLGDTEKSLKLIDVLIMDLEEALKISGQRTINKAIKYFQQRGSSFIITNGSEDSIAYSNGALFQKLEVTKFPVSKKVLNELRDNVHLKGDTTGCGDNFAGGIIASLAWQLKSKEIGNFDLPEALSWAIASGGYACYYIGGTYFEKNSNEKFEKVKKYQVEYQNQIQPK